MKRVWFRVSVAAVFGTAVALRCIAEAIVFRVVLPW